MATYTAAQGTGTLVAATPTAILPGGTDGFDVSGASAWELVISNTGAGDIETVAIASSPTGGVLSDLTELGSAIGSIPAGEDMPPVSMSGIASSRVAVALTSASGTTYRYEFRSVR